MARRLVDTGGFLRRWDVVWWADENVASGLKHTIGGPQEICVGSADCMLDLLPVTCEDSKPDSQGLDRGNKCKLKPIVVDGRTATTLATEFKCFG